MLRTKWTDRKFIFDFPAGWMPNILERLRGTHVRLAEITFPLLQEQLTMQVDGKWSVQEHVGHLLDLEDLHFGRINDFVLRKDTLRPADMTNAKTNAAFHNNVKLSDLLARFKSEREKFTDQLESLDDEILNFRSQHPRLGVLMRPCDMAFFTAEHDDHHMATMRLLINSL